jgi:hypothetical protein
MADSLQNALLASLLEEREDVEHRYIDMAVVLEDSRGIPLLTVGGRWDTTERRYAGTAATGHAIQLQPAQDELGRDLAEWWSRFLAGRWDGYARPYTWMIRGGRSGGKTWLGSGCCVVHALAQPCAIIWAVAAKDDELPEVIDGIAQHVPPLWARYFEAEQEFRFANGSVIRCLSGHKHDNLKKGRVDFAFLNEGQKMDERVWLNVRGRIGDVGGLCLVAFNPHRSARGAWVRMKEERAQKVPSIRATFVDARKNTKRVQHAMDAFREEIGTERETDVKTARSEIDGEYTPIGNTVIYQFSEAHNVLEVPDHWDDITTAFVRRWFGADRDTVLGCDFDRVPHCAGAVLRVYRNPEWSHPVAFWVGLALGEEGEESLVTELLELDGLALPGAPDREKLLEPKRTLCLADSTGRDQAAGKHERGASSWRWLQKAGFTVLSPQHPFGHKNPPTKDRYSLQNMLCESSAGLRRFFIRPCLDWAVESYREYPLGPNARPKRLDVHAHAVDASGYGLWGLFGRDARALDWLPGGAVVGSRAAYTTDQKRRNAWGASRQEALASARAWGRRG